MQIAGQALHFTKPTLTDWSAQIVQFGARRDSMQAALVHI
jgi:hypothetical protein